jgi:outer membrane protein OmpA-like peptidoglycan-associated protein
LWVRISNPLQVEARIAPSIAPSLIVDDLGNRYPLLLPEGEGWISIPGGSARSGTLSFAGRIHPDATRLNIGLNAGSGSRQGEDRIYPELLIRDLPLSGAQAAALPQPVPVGQTLEHPAGVQLQLATLSFSDTGVEVPAVVSNQAERAVALAAEATYAYDDLGNRYPLVPLPDNPQLVVEAGTTIEGTWVFSGRVADGAASLALIVNQGGSADDPATSRPSFQLGPFPLTRSTEGTTEVAAKVFAVGLRSRLVAEELAASQVDQITQTLTQFDATEVEDGFQLTLPDSILFDFGSAELRDDALPALTLIADVLRYFADAPVTVVGHTDSVGSASANQQLSELRAQSVVDALIRDHGIDPGRLTAVGRGAEEPVAPNTNPDGSDNPEGRQLNRRVEIVVHTDQPLPLP